MKNHIQSRSSVTTLEKFPDQSGYLLRQPQNSVSMLVVIDPRVEDYPMLATGVDEGANVLILDLHRDGVEQITEMLVDHPASALHIVCHGSPGCLALGNTYLNLETLNYYSRELQAWSAFLASAPVFLYGCNVAAGEVGEAFLARLHHLTRANIAASANPTGSAKKGGDWELEVTLGDIEGPLAFSEAVREAYTSVLIISINPLTGLAVREGDNTPQTLTVGIDLGLNILTAADATITLDPDDQLDLGNGAGTPVNVTIAAGSTAGNTKNVSVFAVYDGIPEGNHTGTIKATISSSDPILKALPAVSVTANISDPLSLPVLSLTLPKKPLTEGDNTAQTLAVGIDLGLDSLGVPIATKAAATITLDPDDQLDLGNGAGTPINITIGAGSTSGNTKNVSVFAVYDGIPESNQTGTIKATISSSNSILNALPSASVTANINDPISLPVLSLTLPNKPLTEGDNTAQTLAVGINLGLDSLGVPIRTQAAATITLDPDDQLDLGNGVGKPVNVTIAAGSTATDIKNVAVLAVNDGVVEGNHTGTIKATISSANSILNALPSVSVTANIKDPLSSGTGIRGTGTGTGTGIRGTGTGTGTGIGTGTGTGTGTGNSGSSKVIDLRAQANQLVNFNFDLKSEAVYNNSVGLYVVQDVEGTIIDELTNAKLTPGDANYAQVAVRQTVPVSKSELGSDRSASGSEQLNGGVIYAPYLIANGTQDGFLSSNPSNHTDQGTKGQVPFAYFAFLGANPDGIDHFSSLGNNTFAFEDLFGGGDKDYDDLVLQMNQTLPA
ncbi:DUF4347 domain-containing protein [Nostoc sp.]|uniref:DUF4347 domain-containing protein n=1 Tax=Nostoc sp. TaxID=1180 RepID=UPI002FFA17A7